MIYSWLNDDTSQTVPVDGATVVANGINYASILQITPIQQAFSFTQIQIFLASKALLLPRIVFTCSIINLINCIVMEHLSSLQNIMQFNSEFLLLMQRCRCRGVFALQIRYDSVYLTCSKKLTGSQLSLPHGTNKKLKCKVIVRQSSR